MVTVAASQMTRRLIGSPSKAFRVDSFLRYTDRAAQPDDAVGPGFRTAEEDLALGDIGDPVPQRLRLVIASQWSQYRPCGRPPPGQEDHPETAFDVQAL